MQMPQARPRPGPSSSIPMHPSIHPTGHWTLVTHALWVCGIGFPASASSRSCGLWAHNKGSLQFQHGIGRSRSHARRARLSSVICARPAHRGHAHQSHTRERIIIRALCKRTKPPCLDRLNWEALILHSARFCTVAFHLYL
jgi:hypothetical protein